MLSTRQVAMAIAIPLGVSFVLLLIGFVMATNVIATQKHKTKLIQKRHDEISKRLATFPQDWEFTPSVSGYADGDIISSYNTLCTQVNGYVGKWVGNNFGQLIPPGLKGTETESRIKEFLFVGQSEEGHTIIETPEKDHKFFRNEHCYTAAEIAACLNVERDRSHMLEYILMSILLNAISLDGNPNLSLIPLCQGDILNIKTFKSLTRGRFVQSEFPHYIAKYWFNWQASLGNSKPCVDQVFYQFVEDLLEPFLIPCTPEQTAERKLDWKKTLEDATTLGIRIMATALLDFELDWTERQERAIVVHPALKCISYNRTVYPRPLEVAYVKIGERAAIHPLLTCKAAQAA